MCGGIHKEEDAKIVSLATILEIDDSVIALAGLDYGEYSERDALDSDWIVHRKS